MVVITVSIDCNWFPLSPDFIWPVLCTAVRKKEKKKVGLRFPD